MICFQISIFEPLETTMDAEVNRVPALWFAFKLVSLNHWKQLKIRLFYEQFVVICFQISIFEPLETTGATVLAGLDKLWFAFKLVSLNHWKQRKQGRVKEDVVVICFQISIFEPLETTKFSVPYTKDLLWFAFKLVSLNHWKQLANVKYLRAFGCDLLSN